MSDNKIIESSIATPGRGFEPVRNGQPTFNSFTLEVVEIFCGIMIVYFIIGRQLKKATAEEKNLAPKPATNTQVFSTEVEAKKLMTQMEEAESIPNFSKIS